MKQYTKIVLIVAAVVVTACVKVAYDCRYTIVPHIQTVSGGAGTTPDGTWKAYAFYGKEADYHVTASYDTIASGKLWSATDGAYVESALQASQDADGNLVLKLRKPSALVFVCDPADTVFAWREVSISENLWKLEIPLWLRLWRDADYYEGWRVVFPK